MDSIDINRIRQLLNAIESVIQEPYQDRYPKTSERIEKVLEGQLRASLVILELSRILDELKREGAQN